MWLPDPLKTTRRAALFGAAALLAGCGFAPAYGTRGAGSHLLNRIRYQVPNTALGYRLRQSLRDSLGEGTDMVLDVNVTTGVLTSAETRSGEILRYTLPGTATFTLRDSAGGTITSGSVDAFTGYSASASIRAVETAQIDAEDRLARLLAERIITQLLVAAPAR
ncbi:LPS assembly lipoprotein LptE [Ketogulonicigenium vulgare]|uniref:Lipoprotein, putative n=1 Tax=Ketogulonicigenium vulgare (strain WSH-001) TaxID=759362 RepID=F9Y6M6_KETVW|nr:LPS assembly lipoprotein LptE [Ketogulonicigenium vulgare]ADO43888.1 lipoprotein, putative [Ketogulonicigenium vulgare Y25]AEM42146.1 Lipoprotein, putative [Ketogulonicigenium vulgare WSH-001]ALJ79770.1 hypothetical protein KVH_00305 [Ketogulonicigenium vulgare]ANW32690.1 hypothetical protein KvSKV_00315 [Ketogulonicigenium vulgare]AOZ55922.1 lipoprotein [Ketogulonicigenium vulgare]